ncbi:MAG TPA: YbaK/EbsC family protein [Thermomicrobiales bacterium]|nr:YbaK/EbsC family protein [Thermomicrobiales bacterium]
MNEPSQTSATAPTGEALVAYLRERGVEAELLSPGVPMPTVPLAAAAIGVAEDRIIKSLLFRDSRGELVLAIASGTARIDRGLLATATGLDRPRLADPATVLAVTGFPAGGVSPVAHATPVRVVIDRRAAALDVVYGGGGSEDVLLKISPRDIIRLTGAEIVDIAAER